MGTSFLQICLVVFVLLENYSACYVRCWSDDDNRTDYLCKSLFNQDAIVWWGRDTYDIGISRERKSYDR